MNSFLAFTRKEITHQLRSGKLVILGILFLLFGIMNPAIAKLTPWLLEAMADSLEGSGMTITAVTITAMDSWVQFFKNIPIAFIAFILLEGSIFTTEYETGTLVLSLTKGLARYKVILAKTTVLAMMWSIGYWLCFGVTYGYNDYFWSNTLAQNLWLSAICWWIFGLWVIGLTVLFSVLAKSSGAVLAGTGGVVFLSYLLGMVPKIKEYLPTVLTDGNALIYGTVDPGRYTAPLIITIILSILFITLSIPLFGKKEL